MIFSHGLKQILSKIEEGGMVDRKTLMQIAVAVAAVVIAIVGALHYLRQDTRTCEVDDTLEPIAALIDENRSIIDGLRKDGFADSEQTILVSYMSRIRQEGVPKNGAMRQRIDTLANNNTMILAYLSKYAPHARTPAFKVAADQFRDYAISFRDRWQSVFEIFMAGGNLPVTGPGFPVGFRDRVMAEISSIG